MESPSTRYLFNYFLNFEVILSMIFFSAHQIICAFTQAIVNEDASGDVIAMRLQIQQLKVPRCLLWTWLVFFHQDCWNLYMKLERDMKYKLINCSFWVKKCLVLVAVIYTPLCNFQKEVSRLRGLVNGGGDSQDNDSLAVSFPGSPGTLKWEGLYGSMSPLTTGKRMTQVSTVTS